MKVTEPPPPLPNPLAAAEAEMNVELINEAVATDIDDVWPFVMKELVAELRAVKDVWAEPVKVFKAEISVEPPPPLPNPAAAAEADVKYPNAAIWAEPLIVPEGTVPDTAACIWPWSVVTLASAVVSLVETEAETVVVWVESVLKLLSIVVNRVEVDAEIAGYVTSLNLLFDVIEFAWNGCIVVGLLTISLKSICVEADTIPLPSNEPLIGPWNEPLKDP